MVNRPSKKFTVSAPYKRVLLGTCCWSTVEMHLICSWRTRSNSQTGLGAEELLPAEFAFCSCCFFFFFPLLSSFLSSFFLFPYFCFRAVFFFRLISSQMTLSVTQSSSPSPPTWYFKTQNTDNLCMRGHRGRGFESRYRSYSQSGLGAE